MSTRLYVGNLPPDADEDDLARAFGADSRRVTSIRIIRWKNEIDRRYGFAFVEMATEADMRSAIDALDGSELDGRTLRVDEARDRRSHGAAPGSRAGDRGSEVRRRGS